MKPLETHLKTSEFISKLVDMMDKFPSHIGWSKGGDEVIVSQLQELEETVLPVYFRHKKLTSFIRQLNMYGFCKKEQTRNFLKFQHKIFRRDNACQFGEIKRKSTIRMAKGHPNGGSQNNENSPFQQYLIKQAQKQICPLEQAIGLKRSYQAALMSLRDGLDELLKEIEEEPGECEQAQRQIESQYYQKIVNSIVKIISIDEPSPSQMDQAPNFQNYKIETAKGSEVDQCSFQHNEELDLGATNESYEDIYMESPLGLPSELSELY